MEYLTTEILRAEFGDDLEDKTDAQLVRRLDWLTAALEEQLGHAFGRALLLTANSGLTVTVTEAALTLTDGETDTSFLFLDYPTLGELVDAINVSGLATITLLKGIAPETPSSLLQARAAVSCGATYDLRAILDVSAYYVSLSAKRETHLFMPLPVRSITSVTEDGTLLANTQYYAPLNKPWLIRHGCGCTTMACGHKTLWKASYPNNIQVVYRPSWWGTIPGALSQVLLEAFSSVSGLTALESESFGKYSYKRAGAPVASWQDILSGSVVRQFAVKFQP